MESLYPLSIPAVNCMFLYIGQSYPRPRFDARHTKGKGSMLALPYFRLRIAWSILECAPQTRFQMIPPSLFVIPQGWRLIDLLLRVLN
jgi:hypothetical protein